MRINGFCLVNLGPMRDDGVQGWLAVNAIEQCNRSTAPDKR